MLDGEAPGRALSWSEALDLGGSLDTAERANAMRALARAVPPDAPALGHAVGANGGVTWRFLSQREVVRRVQRVWARSRIASGDVAYVTGEVPSLATTVAVLAFTADGHTQVVIGAKEEALEEIGMTRPHKIIAPVETVRRMLESTRISGSVVAGSPVAGAGAVPAYWLAGRAQQARRGPSLGARRAGALAEHGVVPGAPLCGRVRASSSLSRSTIRSCSS